MARALLVAPTYSSTQRANAERACDVVRATGHHATLLEARGVDAAGARSAVQAADALVLLLDAAQSEPGAAWFAGYARATRRPVAALRLDPRALRADDGINAILLAAVDAVIDVSEWSDEAATGRVRDFLDGVRVFAGALVRDSVPRILKEEGREMRFRQVHDAEYPHVIKRKLVETMQRLEESDFGVEQEDIADVLELLETLINLRKYDKESLRSIKEGKWRKRGGYQKGYLLEEEPKVSSG